MTIFDSEINDNIKKIDQVLFLMYFIFESNPFLASFDIIQWPVTMLIGIRYLRYNNVRRFHIKGYFSWFTLQLFFSIISVIWAIDQSLILSDIINCMKNFLVLSFLSFLIIYEIASVKRILALYSFAIFCSALFIIRFLDISNVSDGRLEINIMGSVWNLNYVANTLMPGIITSLYLYLSEKKKIWLVPMGIISATVIFTGSRQAVINILISSFLLIAFISQNKKFYKLTLFAAAILLTYNFIITIPQLYDIVGYRIESLIHGTESKTTSQSNDARKNMIQYGIEWFANRPILGYGTNNYRAVYRLNYGVARYAHNNYIETLVGGGIVGFALYYYKYIVVLFSHVRRAFRDNSEVKFSGILIISLLLSDMFVITKSFFCGQFVLCMAISIIELYKKRIYRIDN